MKQVHRIISTYSADVFGAISALFELGGMIVVHDPSGCNSTYTTHDEPRWFDSKTLLYISALTEKDAVLGNDKRFIKDVTETALIQKPKFIALLPAQMSTMLGIDMNGIAKIIEKNTNIKTFALATTSMQDYSRGISLALEKIAEIITEEIKNPCNPKNRKVDANVASRSCVDTSTSCASCINILGLTLMDFAVNGTDKSIVKFFENRNIPVISTFAMNNTLDDLKKSHNAAFNIVVSYGGLAAARVMEYKWDIPYIIGFPVGKVGEYIVENILQNKRVVAYNKRANLKNDKKIYLIHESIIASSLATALEFELQNKVTVINMTLTDKNLMRVGDEGYKTESELEEIFKSADLIIADPMYKPITKSVSFVSLPHIAFSGRTYLRNVVNLMEEFLDRVKVDTTHC